jgi:hypothetical protein
MVDWAILDYIKVAQKSPKMEKIKKDGKELVWINYRHLIKSMPLLKMKNVAAISNRLKKHLRLGLIHKHKEPATSKSKCNRVYCCVSDKTIAITEFDSRKVPTLDKEGVPILDKDPLYTNKDNKNTNINKLKHKLSKDSTSSSNPTVFKSSLAKKIVNKWNLKKESYLNLKKTSIAKRTKTIQRIEEYLKELEEGTFLKNRILKSGLIEKNNIPSKMNQLSTKEIRQVIKEMLHFLIDGYPPVNKSIVGSLDKMLYDPHFQSSFFLQALYNPPKPIQVIKDPDPEVSNYLRSQLSDNKNLSSTDETKLFQGVKSIHGFVKNIPGKSLKIFKIKSEVGTTLRMCKKYIYWIEHQCWIDGIKVSAFNTNNNLWKKFIKELEVDYQGNKLQ